MTTIHHPDYDWVLFDADDTLFNFDAERGLRLMFSRYGVDFGPAEFADYSAANVPLWQAYQAQQIDAETLQSRRFAAWGQRLGVAPLRLNQQYLLAMADICEMLPGANELLRCLQGRAKLGIITNGFSALQRIRLDKVGLTELIDVLVISEEVGAPKPEKAIFEHALAQMNHPQRTRVLMVGDNPHTDVQGGLNAGLHTCWLNCHGVARPEGIDPHYEVKSLPELQQLLCRAA
jgi:putative hydrolase of the HAD superfamily